MIFITLIYILQTLLITVSLPIFLAYFNLREILKKFMLFCVKISFLFFVFSLLDTSLCVGEGLYNYDALLNSYEQISDNLFDLEIKRDAYIRYFALRGEYPQGVTSLDFLNSRIMNATSRQVGAITSLTKANPYFVPFR
jgi:hypothetical protein